MASGWKISGEIVLSCNCDVFCPCVISLGKANPSQGACHTGGRFTSTRVTPETRSSTD